MTERNRFLPGVVAVALFVAMAVVFLGAPFESAAGFPEGESIVLNLGYALFGLGLGEIPAESFLAAFLIIAIGLDVAIDSAIFLAKREEGSRFATGFGEAETESEPETTAGSSAAGGSTVGAGGDATGSGGDA